MCTSGLGNVSASMTNGVHFVLLGLLHRVAHLARQLAHFAALVREEIDLVLLVLDLLLHPRVLPLLALDLFLDALEHIVVIARVLVHLVLVRVQVQHAFGEAIQERGIVRDDDARFVVHHQERRKMVDALLIQVVRRLVEQQEIRLLNERECQEQPRLLPAGELAQLLVHGRAHVHGIEHLGDVLLDVVLRLRERALKELAHGVVEHRVRQHLLGDADGHAFLLVDLALGRFQLLHDQLEDGALARAVLPHDGELGVLAHREARAFQNRLVVIEVESHVLKPEDDIAMVHGNGVRGAGF